MTDIVIKNRISNDTAPSGGDLLKGELAVNLVSFKLYTSTDGTDVEEISPASTVTVGTLTAGDGLVVTNAGDMSGNIELDVGAGAGLSVDGTDVTLDMTSANTWTGVQTFGAGVVEKTNVISGTGSNNLDCDTGNNFTILLVGTTPTYTFTNPPSSGEAFGCTVTLTQPATATTCVFTGVLWPYGTVPDVPGDSQTAVYTFLYDTVNTQWYGFKAGDEMST